MTRLILINSTDHKDKLVLPEWLKDCTVVGLPGLLSLFPLQHFLFHIIHVF